MEVAFGLTQVAFLGVLLAWHLDNKRHAAQMEALLERISTEPRLELHPANPFSRIDAAQRKYIADHEADDAAWNEFRGEPTDDEE